METLNTINRIIMWILLVCYSYQFVYIAVALFSKPHTGRKEELHKIAILIAARNEQAVIACLLDSIAKQTYPSEYLDVYLVADNCTDATAMISEAHGAIVYERHDTEHIGKGYALNFLAEKIKGRRYDAYVVLDADNVLDADYIKELNRVFSDGHDIVTSYINAKNYGDNWISAGCGLLFLRECSQMNRARMVLSCGCSVSGAGFLFSERIFRKQDGWNYFLLTEDVEFAISSITDGTNPAFAENAILYSEQPTEFRQSWNQRLRWSRGYLQVIRHYGKRLLSGIPKSFSCFDMAMNIMPAAVLSGVGVVINIVAAILGFLVGGSWSVLCLAVLRVFSGLYITVFLLGFLTTLTQWRRIQCSAAEKLLYAFTFPLFMATYIPVCIASLFVRPCWKPIKHGNNASIEQIAYKK